MKIIPNNIEQTKPLREETIQLSKAKTAADDTCKQQSVFPQFDASLKDTIKTLFNKLYRLEAIVSETPLADLTEEEGGLPPLNLLLNNEESMRALGNICLGSTVNGLSNFEGWQIPRAATFFTLATKHLEKHGVFSQEPLPQEIVYAFEDLSRQKGERSFAVGAKEVLAHYAFQKLGGLAGSLKERINHDQSLTQEDWDAAVEETSTVLKNLEATLLGVAEKIKKELPRGEQSAQRLTTQVMSEVAPFRASLIESLIPPTGYLGHSEAVIVQQLDAFLERLSQDKNYELGSSSLKASPKMQAQELTCNLENLPRGQSFSVPLGWKVDRENHAIAVRFEKTTVDTFNIYIYNAHGAEELLAETNADKHLSYPCLKFENITADELFMNKAIGRKKEDPPLLFERLYSLLNPQNDTSYTFTAFLNNFAPLYHRLKLPKESSGGVTISAQSFGNCPVKTLLCLALQMRGDKTKHKLFTLDLRLFTLLATHAQMQKLPIDSSEGAWLYEEQATMLKEAATQLLKLVDKHQALMTPEAYNTGVATIKDLLAAVAKEGQAKEDSTPAVVGIDILPNILPMGKKHQPIPLKEEEDSRLDWLNHIAPTPIAPHTPSRLSPLPSINKELGKGTSWESLKNGVSSLQKQMKWLTTESNPSGYSSSSTPIAMLQYETFIDHLRPLKNTPFPTEEVDLKTTQETLSLLQKCLEAYMFYVNGVNQSRQTQPTPAQQNAVMETLALAYLLAQQVDRNRTTHLNPGELSHYSLDYAAYRKISDHPMFYVADPKALAHRNELLDFFAKSAQPGSELFSFFSETNELTIGDFTQKRYPEARFHGNTQSLLKNKVDLGKLSQEAARKHQVKQLELWESLCRNADPETKAYKEMQHFYQLKKMAILTTEMFSYYWENSYDPWSHRGNLPSSADAYCRLGNIWLTDSKQIPNPASTPFNQSTVATTLTIPIPGDPKTPVKMEVRAGRACWEYDQTRKGKKERAPKKTDPLSSKFPFSNLSRHQKSQLPTENERVVNPKKDLLAKWANALSVPGAEASALLQDLTRQLAYLSVEEIKDFRVFLYKTIDTSSKTDPLVSKSPLFAQMKEDPQFLQRLFLIGKEGLKLWKDTPKKQAELQVLLQLQGELLSQYRQVGTAQISKEFLQLIEEQLAWLSTVTEQKQGREKFSFRVTEASLLTALPFETLSVGGKVSLFFCFLDLYQNRNEFLSRTTTQYEPFLSLMERASALEPEWEKELSKENSALCAALLQKVDPGAAPSSIHKKGLKVTIQEKGQKEDKGRWKINFGSYLLTTPRGPFGDSHETISLATLSRLGITELPAVYRKSEGSYLFDDPRWGAVKVSKREKSYYDTTPDLVLERFCGEPKKWYTYHAPDQLTQSFSQNQLNAALIYDHAAWISSTNEKELILTDLNTGIPLYQTNGEGKLVSIENPERSFSPSGYQETLTQIEDPQHIATWIDPISQTTFYALPRFAEKPLFIQDKDEPLRYDKNPSFYLDTGEGQPHFGLRQVLQLQTKDHKQRLVLIPYGEIASTAFSSQCKVQVESINPIKLPSGNPRLSTTISEDGNKGACDYFEYEVKNGELQPKTLNGRIYLAHLYLAQKKYQKAVAMIESISMTEVPDTKSWTLFSALLKPGSWDNSPKANAVRLKAYVHFLKLAPQGDPFQTKDILALLENTSTFKLGMTAYQRYLASPHILTEGISLTQSEELDLLHHFKGELVTGLSETASTPLKLLGNEIATLAKNVLPKSIFNRMKIRIKRIKHSAPVAFATRTFHRVLNAYVYSNKNLIPSFVIKIVNFALAYFKNLARLFPIQIDAKLQSINKLTSGQLAHRFQLLANQKESKQVFTRTTTPFVEIDPLAAYQALVKQPIKELLTPLTYIHPLEKIKPLQKKLKPVIGRLSPVLQRRLHYKTPENIKQFQSSILEITAQPAFQKMYEEVATAGAQDRSKLLQSAYTFLYAPPSQEATELSPLAKWLLLLLISQKLQYQTISTVRKLPEKNQVLSWVRSLMGFTIPELLIASNTSRATSPKSDALRDPMKISYAAANDERSVKQKAADPTPPASVAVPLVPVHLLDEEPSFAEKYVETSEKNLKQHSGAAPKGKTPEETHLNFYKEDIQIATEQLDNKSPLKAGASRDTLKVDLSQAALELENKETPLIGYIEALLKKPFETPQKNLHQFVQTEGRDAKQPTVEMVCRAAAHFQNPYQELAALNPALSKEELISLREKALNLMMLQTSRQHFEFILSKIATECSDSELAFLVEMKRQYSATQDPFFLYFEWISKMRIRPAQKDVLEKAKEAIFKNESFVFQLIMAGGKSSVIFSTLLEMISNCTQQVPCVIAHHSQYGSTMSNLKSFQQDRFGKDLIGLDATLHELSNPVVVQNLLDRFEKAKKERSPLVMRSSFPQILHIKMVLASLDATGSGGVIPEHLKLINKLFEKIKKEALFVFDEIDSSLSMRFDVRSSFGEITTFPGDEMDMIRAIYTTLTSEKLNEITSLLTNEQESLSPEQYKAVVLPEIAEALFAHPSFRLGKHPEFKGAFARFLRDQIPAEHQDITEKLEAIQDVETRENVAFFRFLSENLTKQTAPLKRSCELISSARNFVQNILPVALSRNCLRNYGPKIVDQKDEGAVIPYQASGEPATTHFANPHLTAAFHIQAALVSKISPDEISFLGKKLLKDAESAAAIEKKPLADTLEEKQFQRMTGISLREIDKQEKLAEAAAYTNQELSRKLLVRGETAPLHIGIHTLEIYANAIHLAAMARVNNGGSGTLYNHPSFNIALRAPHLDRGTEGQVLKKMLSNADAGEAPIFDIPHKALSSILEKLDTLSSEDKKRSSGLIDIGGFLKSELSVNHAAARLQKHFADHPEYNKKAIVYLHKFPAAGGKTSEQYVILKEGSSTPSVLANTSWKTLKKHNIPLDQIFFIWDELRTTGTDFPLPGTPDAPALCFATLDPSMPARNLLQGFLRCRGYLNNQQKIIPIIAETERELFENSASHFNDIINTTIVNESKAIQKETTTSYTEQLLNILVQEGLSSLSSAIQKESSSELAKAFKQYEPFLISKKNHFAYSQWAKLQKEVETLPLLESVFKSELTGTLDRKVKREGILASAEGNPYLPASLTTSARVDQETLTEVVVETQEMKESNQLKELEEELQKLLEKYQYGNTHSFYDQVNWTPDWKTGDLPPSREAQPVTDFLNTPISGSLSSSSTQRFAPCFPENLHLTTNLKKTLSTSISVFHQQFKPVHFVLMVQKGGKLHAVLLSKFDTEKLQKHLKNNPREGVWLLNLQGFEDRDLSTAPLPQSLSEEARKLIWYANLFNGNADYLNREDNKPFTDALVLQNKNPALGEYLLLKSASSSDRNEGSVLEALKTGLISSDIFRKFNISHISCAYRREEDLKMEERSSTSFNAGQIAAENKRGRVGRLVRRVGRGIFRVISFPVTLIRGGRARRKQIASGLLKVAKGIVTLIALPIIIPVSIVEALRGRSRVGTVTRVRRRR